MSEICLALDIGTSSTKAALLDHQGQVLRSAAQSYPLHSSAAGFAEQDARDWWRAVIAVCQELKTDDVTVESVVVTGQMQDVILIDADGEPLCPVLLYSDMRAQAEAETVLATLGQAQLRQWTGNDQGADGLLAKLLWLQRHEPEVLAQCAHILLGAADYAVLKMTGSAFCDSTTASTTGLLDINSRAILAAPVFEQLGLAEVVPRLPSIVPGGALAGMLSTQAAAELRLPAEIPVYLGPGDAGAATLGAGCGEPGSVYAYLGTSGWVAFTSEARGDPEQGVITLAHPKQGYFIQVAPLLTAGGNLDWIADLFGTADYAQIIDAALVAEPSSLIYLPYLAGERSPFRDPDARGAFIGLNRSTTRDQIYRAVLEGIAFAYRHAMEALLDGPASRLVMTGGGTRSRDFCQRFADITQTPVIVARDAENTGLRGVQLAAQVLRDEHNQYTIAVDAQAVLMLPDQVKRAHYDRQYAIFRMAYPALHPVFTAMAGHSN